ncbi:MAG: right-handed parallel beta-helix repeat-containing protein, partial [Anaerolineae bacterium]|nr:right-handed parallel beta-helix repeat-containing protein [Anaerolineae bacterium]
MKSKGFLLGIAIPLVMTLGLLRLLDSVPSPHPASPARPQWHSSLQQTSPITRYVSITGTDASNDCTVATKPCATIQRAVDVAQSGDLILISGGVFSTEAALIPSVVYVADKSLSFQGGYTTAFTARDPEAWPTVVDGKRSLRGFSVVGAGTTNVVVTIDGLHIRNGYGNGAGGGIYVSEANLILTGTHLYSNVAAIDLTGSGTGGGLYAITAALYISGCTFSHNIAHQGSGSWGMGGGLYLQNSVAEIRHSRFYSNVARMDSMGYGGGLYLELCRECRIENNVIRYNWASKSSMTPYSGKGGGICVNRGDQIIIKGNEIAENVAAQYSSGDFLTQGHGGGLMAFYYGGRGLIVEGNRFLGNTAALQSAGGTVGAGGGLFLWGTFSAPISVTIRANLFQDNVANRAGRGMG